MPVIPLKEKTSIVAHVVIEQANKPLIEQPSEPLNESVRQALRNYFSQLQGEEPKGIYQMILAEVEVPLLEAVMKHTKNNQVRTATFLGLSRGTVRAKLKAYGML
jgi:Fis family transcriptional regulator